MTDDQRQIRDGKIRYGEHSEGLGIGYRISDDMRVRDLRCNIAKHASLSTRIMSLEVFLLFAIVKHLLFLEHSMHRHNLKVTFELPSIRWSLFHY